MYNKFVTTEAVWLQTIERSLASAAIGLIAIAGFYFHNKEIDFSAWKLGSKVVNSHVTFSLMIAGACISLLYSSSWLFPIMMVMLRSLKSYLQVCGGLTTLIEWKIKEWRRKKSEKSSPPPTPTREVNNKFNVVGIGRPTAFIAIAIFILLAIVLLIGKLFISWKYFLYTEVFFRMGSLIFGGGQVVIPMLLTELVDKGYVNDSTT